MDNKEKYICKSCGEDLREVGIYYKEYNNCAYNEVADKFVYSSSDCDGNYCANCDSYVDFKCYS